MLGAVVYGHEQMQAVINLINELADEAGKPLWDWSPPQKDEALVRQVAELAEAGLQEAYRIRQKQQRSEKVEALRNTVIDALVTNAATPADENMVATLFSDLESKIVRGRILGGEPRIDGRDTRTVRAISIRTGVLPRAHGSALFTRGETQALVVATLGTARDEQIIDALQGEYSERFMLHYNMPPYATGETGRVGRAQAPRDRSRPSGQARAGEHAAHAGAVRLLDARGVRDHRVQRIELHGQRVRRLSGADGCGRADEGARGRHRDGADQGRQPLRRAERHPGRRGSPRRHGLQGGGDRARRDRAADGHQDPGHHQGDHAGRPESGARGPHAHPRPHAPGAGDAAAGDLGLCAAHDHHQDQAGEDPRRDRQGRRGDPRHHRGDRDHHRHRRGRHRHHRLHQLGRRPGREEAHRGHHRRGRGRPNLRRHRAQAARLRRDRHRCCRARTVCCTSRRSPRSASRTSATT